MSGHFFEIDHGRPREFFVDPSAVSVARHVALGVFQKVEEMRFHLGSRGFLSELDCPASILNHLDGLDP